MVVTDTRIHYKWNWEYCVYIIEFDTEVILDFRGFLEAATALVAIEMSIRGNIQVLHQILVIWVSEI